MTKKYRGQYGTASSGRFFVGVSAQGRRLVEALSRLLSRKKRFFEEIAV